MGGSVAVRDEDVVGEGISFGAVERGNFVDFPGEVDAFAVVHFCFWLCVSLEFTRKKENFENFRKVICHNN